MSIAKHTILQESSQEWAKLISQLSHILCTKLATLRLKEIWIQDAFSALLDNKKHLGQEKKLDSYSLRDAQQVGNLSQQIDPSMELFKKINQLLPLLYSQEEVFSISTLVTCLTADMVTPIQRDRITFTNLEQEIICKGSTTIVHQLVTFLLIRALHKITNSGQGNIEIKLATEETFATLHIKEIGFTLSEPNSFYDFAHFISLDNEQVITLGLGFFRLAIWHQGGDIQCNRASANATDFIIKLRKASHGLT